MGAGKTRTNADHSLAGSFGNLKFLENLNLYRLPATLTQLLFPISNAIMTRIAADLGDSTVAAFELELE